MAAAAASSKAVAKQYARIIAQWPKDPIRPSIRIADAIQYNISNAEKGAAELNAELRNINALNSLLGNRYSKRYPLSSAFMHPRSNPDHYDYLVSELDAEPNRTWLQRWLNSWKGKIRWK